MSYDVLSALIVFAFVATITPGPNNLMVMASGANFGFKRTIPHMIGIGVGFSLMVVLVGIGLVRVFDLYPVSRIILKIFSVGYMVFLAIKIARSAPPDASQRSGVPITFIQAALFQWVNPKAWAMALGSVTLFAASQDIKAVLLVALAFALVSFPCVSSWAVLGQQMRRWLNSPNRLRVFNFSMAFLLIASLVPVIF